MSVHGCIKTVPHDTSEDDDEPLVFRRTSTATKQNPPSSASKISAQKNDRPLGRSAPGHSMSNGQSSNLLKSNVVSSSKPTGRSAAENLNSQASKSNPPKHSSEQRLASAETNSLAKTYMNDKSGVENSDDSDDDKPLTSRLNTVFMSVQKSGSVNNSCSKSANFGHSDNGRSLSSKYSTDGSMHSTKVFESQKTKTSQTEKMNVDIKKQSDDSEDEKTLLSKLGSKAGSSGSSVKNESTLNEKPLNSKVRQNGSVKGDSKSEVKLHKNLSKRPLDGVNDSGDPLAKKSKVSATFPATVKHESIVKELKVEDDDEDDHIPISQRIKVISDNPSTKKVVKKIMSSSLKKESKKIQKTMKNSKYSKSLKVPPGSGGGQKWTTLEHNGVIFPPPYKPHGIKMLYNGQPVSLTPEQEEVATMFAVMKDTDYATKPKFIENFMNDWRQILGKTHVIKKFELCDFTPLYEWHLREKEKKKQMTSEEKKVLKEEKLKQEEKYMWAIVDGVKEKVGNFRVEPPGLFRGRGEHPKMGKLKKRIRPRDITINIGKGAPVPECPIPGERWKEIKHDNTVTWLAFWNDPINPKEFKYVFLAASSSLKGQSDKEKYEKARLLKDYIHGIRATYTKDFNSKDATKRQIAVATYLIDKLALRAGNEKDDDEADTVGCCTLKVENVTLVPPNKLQFDFLGKDSIRYFNTVEVELPVYKAIGDFQNAKKSSGGKKVGGDDLFDLLDTSKLNAHLKELMPGLTAKVFRTYNASITLDDMLNRETKDGTLPEKIAVYQLANKEVAIICNHQRSVSKSHDAQMTRLNEKIDELKAQQEELKVDLSRARKGKPPLKDAEGKLKKNLSSEVLEKKLAQIDAKIEKMELDKKTKEDLKTVALGTSKINYLDPRISVAWCKRHEVPIEKIFNKSLLAKFAWAMDVDPSFRF
ncbi:DNA topoisomerase I protein [Dioscorea alata]|uniref:DNA topoisomerase I protein n=4 Tax=Dioscorea alata TaxID=55571 RepID=A0ACB7UJ70_DIOAL|nr:DNA topoisomerase I protein [Dioscorea alata]KAH7660305.1 DNA topoisomerase I protein [Dioscorea alata]KAH7660306.1 DNA topoisomerase I protein [Dioscorea alata]KAH7660307.1 DNA topoisomerase I protein [Dioscorea alata]